MAPPTIRELTKEPFGPYPDHFVLNPNWVPKGRNLPQLRRLGMRQNQRNIGLDISERYIEPPAKPSSPVSFWGVLIIEDLAWLSARGVTLLTRELHKRDENWPVGLRSSQNSKRATENRQLSLPRLYGSNFKISIWIMCERENPALFLTAKYYTESLLLCSKDQHRLYEIVTMERETYHYSSNFLERFRIVAVIEAIAVKYDLPPNTTGVDPFVNGGTFDRCRVGENSPSPCLTRRSQGKIRCALWLASSTLFEKSKCRIDVRTWCEFITKVRIAKKTRKSKKWSVTYEDDDIWASDDDGSPSAIAKTLAKFGGTAEFWEKKLRSAITGQVKPPTLWSMDEKAITSSSKRVPVTYDSDFSEASTPGCSDSEYDSDSPSSRPFHPLLLHMAQPPTLQPGRFIWDCPVPKCEFSLNLLNFREGTEGRGSGGSSCPT
ncbi:hypothetical protein K438DRAFT_523303 [Mycena galopus ATCC 62051]|nr:hypothetical protein K438DRAFT_523303 [Mycena galopus ATCC 62051]